jgi:hypothetical protein
LAAALPQWVDRADLAEALAMCNYTRLDINVTHLLLTLEAMARTGAASAASTDTWIRARFDGLFRQQ